MPSASSFSSSSRRCPAAGCCWLARALALCERHKYAAQPVLAIYAVQMQLVLPFVLRSGAAINPHAVMRPFRRMYAKGVEFDPCTLLTIASV